MNGFPQAIFRLYGAGSTPRLGNSVTRGVKSSHHQLREKINEVLGRKHHWGVQRNHEAGPQSQVQICRQLLLTNTQSHQERIETPQLTGAPDHLRDCMTYPVEVMENVGRVSRSEARRGDTDDGHAVRDLYLLLHSGQVVRLALCSAWHVAELHCSMIHPLA